MQKFYFKNIDGLRTIAILPVLIVHILCLPALNKSIKSQFLDFVLKITPGASFGVTLFFVISGFLITYLLFEEKTNTGKVSIKLFYLRRVFRIWPLYFFVILFGFTLLPFLNEINFSKLPLNGQIPWENWWNYVFFLANYDVIFSGKSSPIMSVLWSVSIEEQFYLFWPLVIAYLSKRKILIFFVITMLAGIFWRIKFSDYGGFYHYHICSCLFDLTLGSFCAYLVFYYKDFKEILKNLSMYYIALGYLIGLYILYFGLPQQLPFSGLTGDILISIFFSFCILEQSYSENSLFKLSNFKFMTTLGKFTYSAYCLHLIVLYFYVMFLNSIHIENIISDDILIALLLFGSIFFTLCISYLSYYYYEIKFIIIKQKYS